MKTRAQKFAGMPGFDATLSLIQPASPASVAGSIGKFEPGPFLRSGQFTDVLIVGRDGACPAHRLVLGAVCRWLKALFLARETEEWGEEVVVHLPEFSRRQIRAWLEFVYGLGQPVLARDLADFLGCGWVQPEFVVSDLDERQSPSLTEVIAEDLPIEIPREKRTESRKKLLGALRDAQPVQCVAQAQMVGEDFQKDELNRHYCPVIDCNYTCVERDFLVYHINQLHRSVTCHQCGMRCPKLKLPAHVRHAHPLAPPNERAVTFTTEDNVEQKLRMDAQHRLLCPTVGCPFAHPELAVIMKHIDAHVSEICDQCHKVFSKKTIQSHQLKAHKASESEVECSDCHRTFTDASCLARHRKARHPQAQDCVCRWCGKTCLLETSLKIHEISCEKRGRPSKRRPNASAAQMQQRKKKKLQEVDLSNVKVQTDFLDPNKCARCAFTSPDPLLLKQHWISKHEYRECEHCGKMYSFNYIDQHIAVHHTKELDFECEFCGKRFWMESYLINHRDEEHIKEYKFHCVECDISFVSQNRLSRHKIKDHKNRHFPCKYCDKTYMNKESLKKHFQKVHGIPIENVKDASHASIIPLPMVQGVLHDPDGKKMLQLEQKSIQEQKIQEEQQDLLSKHQARTASEFLVPSEEGISHQIVVQEQAIIHEFPVHHPTVTTSISEEHVQEMQLVHIQPELDDPDYVTTTYTITM